MRRVLVLGAVCAIVHANAGIFAGSGHTIELSKTEKIRLVSEDVTIIPGRSRGLFGGSDMDRVEYVCKFLLRNLTDKGVEVQVGFPLDSQFMKSPYDPKEYDERDLVLSYKFIARDADRTYHVRYAPGRGDLRSIFLWDMAFAPNETRELFVTYEMPISMGLGTTAKARGEDGKDWYSQLEFALVEEFRYVTKTGRSWAGEIENARFRIGLRHFEEYVRKRGFFEGEEPGRRGKPLTKAPWIVRRIEPAGWRMEDGCVTWQLKGEVPEGPLRVAFYVTGIPTNPKEIVPFARSILGDKPAEEDLADFKEILRATFGVAPETPRVRDFVSRQVWYEEKPGVELTDAQRALVEAVDGAADAYERGKRDAEADLRAGKLGWEHYGQPMGYDRIFKKMLKDEHEIDFRIVAGCAVPKAILDHARGYNEIMAAAFVERFGSDVIASTEKRARQKFDEERAK